MIALGCDHGGYELKQEIIKYLEENNIEYKDFGCDSTDSTDYPIYAKRVAIAIQNGDCEKGILICGTGIGISITANKFKVFVQLFVPTASVQRQQDFITMPIFLQWAAE
mgnify:CR=1 FL=1